MRGDYREPNLGTSRGVSLILGRRPESDFKKVKKNGTLGEFLKSPQQNNLRKITNGPATLTYGVANFLESRLS
jgi:hypothetical protein